MKIFAIYDSKAEAYLTPFFSPTKATALRSFAQAANQSESDFHRFASDYHLFELGTWDERKGQITPHKAITSLGCALEYIDKEPASNGALRQMEIA